MVFSSLLVAICASTLALASPAPRSTSPPSACANLFNGLPNDDQTFNLTAFYDDKTQKQLFLSSWDSGKTFHLATNDTVTNPLGFQFTLTNSSVTALGVPASPKPKIATAASADNSLLGFKAGAKPVVQYCYFFNTSPEGGLFPYSILGVNGDSDNYSACKSTSGGEEVIVYNAQSASGLPFDVSTCEGVHLLVVQPFE